MSHQLFFIFSYKYKRFLCLFPCLMSENVFGVNINLEKKYQDLLVKNQQFYFHSAYQYR